MCYDHLATWYDAVLSVVSVNASYLCVFPIKSNVLAQRVDVHSNRQLPMT